MAKKATPKKAKIQTKPQKSKVVKTPKKLSEAEIKRKKQIDAIILMAIAVLLGAFTLISGDRAWLFVHNLLHGLFGLCAYAVPVLLVVISIIIAKENPEDSVRVRIWQAAGFVLLLSSALQIFMSDVKLNFFETVGKAYYDGIANTGGGVLGVVIGYPLEFLFTNTGSKIIIVILCVVLAMIITGTTIMSIARNIKKPVDLAKESIEKAIEDNRQMRENKAKDQNIDIALGEGYLAPEDEISSPEIEKLKDTIGNFYGERGGLQAPQIPVLAPAKAEKEDRHGRKAENASLFELSNNDLDENYTYPPLSLLDEQVVVSDFLGVEEQQTTADLLVRTLQDFGISTKIVHISKGPSVTRYELEPSAGVKISRITGLADDIALRLATSGVRIEAPIPNKAAVGIEVPNKVSQGVCLRELIGSKEFAMHENKLTVALGKDIAGNLIFANLANMPHLLIAGTTGSGKSVCTNAIIQSVLYKASPKDVKMILIDPKQVEFGVYNGIPHLLVPVVTDPRKAAGALGWAVTEMLKRYKMFAENNVRDIKSYNDVAKNNDELEQIPLILIVIDELSDLMMAASNEVEDAIIRLAQMARAAGMHLVIATQRPSVDVITGLIKANIPSRLALTVASSIDSRTILDAAGAEKLLGRGDMLFMPLGMSKPLRVQGCFVSSREVEEVVNFLKNNEEHSYSDEVIEEINRQAESAGKTSAKKSSSDEDDERLMEAIELVIDAGEASTSMLQRRLSVGYARAGRMMDQMEDNGFIGPHQGSKPREVLLSRQQWLEMNLNREID